MVNVDLLNFVIQNTQSFDESHDVHHAMAVYSNAQHIAKQDFPWCNAEIIEYSAMLHDVCDHKYPQSITKKERNDFIKRQLPFDKALVVIDVINNISFSQEVKGLRKTLPKPFNIYQDIISDADKLEALGAVGLQRCIVFTEERGGSVPEDVIAHCHEKLLRLKDEFIRTPTGRLMAEPRHQFLQEYCNERLNYVKRKFTVDGGD